MQVFFPVIGCHFKLKKEAQITLLSDSNNAKFLHFLNLLPGCLPVSAWETNEYIQSIDVNLARDSLLMIDKLTGKRLETQVHFSFFKDAKPGAEKYRFTILLRDINNKLEIYY